VAAAGTARGRSPAAVGARSLGLVVRAPASVVTAV